MDPKEKLVKELMKKLRMEASAKIYPKMLKSIILEAFQGLCMCDLDEAEHFIDVLQGKLMKYRELYAPMEEKMRKELGGL